MTGEKWIPLYESFFGTKLRKTSKVLGCAQGLVAGTLPKLWVWGLTNATEQGLIAFTDREDLENVVLDMLAGSNVTAKAFIDAIFECGWLDDINGEIYFHDWSDWSEYWYNYIRKKNYDAERKRKKRHPEKDQEQPGENAEVPVESPEPVPQEKAEKSDPPEPKKKMPGYAPSFEQFWKEYPRKIDKGSAYQKYQTRLKDGFSEEDLLEAARNYAAECRKLKTETQYIKHPKTFLSDKLPFTDYIRRKEQPARAEAQGDNPFEEWGAGNG